MLNELLKKLWKNWLGTKRESKFLYLCLASAFFALVCIFFRSNTVLSGTFLLASVCFYFAWQSAIGEASGNAINSSTISKIEANTYADEPKKPNRDFQRNIRVEQGNYNESIAGDYINIQGNIINVNQEFPAFIDKLADILERLDVEQDGLASLRERIIHDLENALQHNPKFKRNFRKWRSRTGQKSGSNSNVEMAEILVEKAEEARWNAVDKKVEFDEEIYGKLENYLRIGDWEEADNETVAVIIKILTKELGDEFTSDLEDNKRKIKNGYFITNINLQGLSAENIILIPAIHLKYIDQLWTKYSSGRFGFSVQKRIAREIEQRNHHYGSLIRFGKRVGWHVDGDWIVITDIEFSTNAPPGHLPYQLYIAANSYRYPYKLSVCLPILESVITRLYA